jgi:hypothetical protein
LLTGQNWGLWFRATQRGRYTGKYPLPPGERKISFGGKYMKRGREKRRKGTENEKGK